jgi:hypothetical protein
MEPSLNSVFNDALKLPVADQRKLADKLLRNTGRTRKKQVDLSKYLGIFDSGDPRSADNEKIDSDLAREYADDHEPKN